MVLQSNGMIRFSEIAAEYKLTGMVRLSSIQSADIRIPQSGVVRISHTFNKYYLPNNGLRVWLCARDSYPGSGNTWNNIISSATNATLVNSPSYVSSPPYLDFNGTNQYGSLPSVASVTNFTNTQDYTICTWVWIAATQRSTATSDNDVIEKWTGGAPYPYVMRWDRANRRFVHAMYNGTTSTGIAPPVNSFPTNTWIFVVSVFNNTQTTHAMYLNGNLLLSGTRSLSGSVSNSHRLYLMARGTPSNHTTGRMSMVFIYNRALTSTEITDLYSSTRGILGV